MRFRRWHRSPVQLAAVVIAAAALTGIGCSDPFGPGGGSGGGGGGTGTGTGGGGGGGQSGAAGQFGRITYEDLTYLGCFACPDKPSWAFAKGMLAWLPTRNRLVAVGKSFAELEVPQPVISENPSDLNIAYDPTQMFDPMAQLSTMLDPAKTLGGVVWYQNRFWFGTYEFYNVAGRDNLGISSEDENWGDPRGAWRVGPAGVNTPSADVFHANKTHCDVMLLPQDWAQVYTPGRQLAGGRTRGAGAFGSGRGPQLYAFKADPNTAVGGDLGGIPLMYFQEHNQVFPGYRFADKYHSIWIWRGNRHAVITGARKGLGPNIYGPGTSCSPDKGWQSDPYEPRMYFFDVNDFGEVVRGNMMPWDVRPFEEVMPTEMWNDPTDASYNPGCKEDWMIGWAWDPDTGLLYASQPRAYQVPGPSNRMIVHVWQVN